MVNIPPIKMVMTGGWCKWHCFTIEFTIGLPLITTFKITISHLEDYNCFYHFYWFSKLFYPQPTHIWSWRCQASMASAHAAPTSARDDGAGRRSGATGAASRPGSATAFTAFFLKDNTSQWHFIY